MNTALVGVVVVADHARRRDARPATRSRASRAAGGRALGVGIFLVYLVPPTLLFLPLSRVIAELGLQDRLWSLILVYPAFTIPFATWLLMGFFKTIPRELEDAAPRRRRSRLRTLVSVVFPISVPGILTVVIFSFSLVVNEFVYAVSFITASTQQDGLDRDLHRADPRRRLLLGRADGRDADPEHPARTALQRVPRPLHPGVHRRSVPLRGNRQKGGGEWRTTRRHP